MSDKLKNKFISCITLLFAVNANYLQKPSIRYKKAAKDYIRKNSAVSGSFFACIKNKTAMKKQWIHFSRHALERLKERHIPKKTVLRAFRRMAEIPREKFMLLITPGTFKNWFGENTKHTESLFVVAHCRCVITCYFCKDEVMALEYSRHGGKRIIIVN